MSDALDGYFNKMQMIANLADTNTIFGEIGRAGGKTDGILGPRSLRIAYDMPRSKIILGGPTYVSLMQNIVPNLLSYYRSLLPNGRTLLTEGIHYVVGKRDLPKHFLQPISPIVEPKHTITFSCGTSFQLVSADRPESAAGVSAAAALVEEMKHIDGQKLKSRVFPAIRGNRKLWGHSQYFQGITGISDTARVDLGEDDWFLNYEKNMDVERIGDIINAALHVNAALYAIQQGKDVQRNRRVVDLWAPRLVQMRKGTTLYLRFSSFVNRDILGMDFFIKQFENLNMDEFLSSIANVRPQKVANMFFANFTRKKHCFSDSYKYDFIDKFGLDETMEIESRDLRHCNKSRPLFAGFDPGAFMSMVVGQKKQNEFRVLKNFYQISPDGQHKELAEDFNRFFAHHKERKLYLYHDRAGNQKGKYKNPYTGDLTDTDAIILQRELKQLGWNVELMNKKQRTIFFWEHYNLLTILLSENRPNVDKLRICEAQCAELISSIFVSPLKKTAGKIELDKTSEVKIPYKYQAERSTQIATSLMYLLFGLYEKYLPSGGFSEIPDYDTHIL